MLDETRSRDPYNSGARISRLSILSCTLHIIPYSCMLLSFLIPAIHCHFCLCAKCDSAICERISTYNICYQKQRYHKIESIHPALHPVTVVDFISNFAPSQYSLNHSYNHCYKNPKSSGIYRILLKLIFAKH